MIFMVCHHWFCPKWWICNGYSAASQVFADCYEKVSGLKQDQRICIKNNCKAKYAGRLCEAAQGCHLSGRRGSSFALV
jgi:hypothetical protein